MFSRFCAWMLVGLTALAQNLPIGSGVNFYSQQKEAALGAQLAQPRQSDGKRGGFSWRNTVPVLGATQVDRVAHGLVAFLAQHHDVAAHRQLQRAQRGAAGRAVGLEGDAAVLLDAAQQLGMQGLDVVGLAETIGDRLPVVVVLGGEAGEATAEPDMNPSNPGHLA